MGDRLTPALEDGGNWRAAAGVAPAPAGAPGVPGGSSANMFDAIDPGLQEAPAPRAPNMFDEFPDVDVPKTTGLSAAFTHAVRGVLPTAGGMAAAGAGAEAGAALGAFAGPPGAAVGAFVGGVGGFLAGSYGTGAAQDWALHQMPDSWQEAIGQSDREQRLQESQHPVYSFLGGLAPYALTMSPGAFTTKALNLPENATTFERLMANPVTSRLFGGVAMGGMELGNEVIPPLVSGEQVPAPDWTKIAISTGFGMVFNKPTRLGEYIVNLGAEPARAAMTSVRGAAMGAYMLRSPMEMPREGVLNPLEPTLAQAGDLGVMGPGVTESTFQGSAQRSEATRTTAQNAASDEAAALGALPAADHEATARRLDPEAFAERDTLAGRIETLRRFIANESNPPPEAFDDLASRRYMAEEALRNSPPNSPDARNLRAQLAGFDTELAELQGRQQAWESGEHVDSPAVTEARLQLVDAVRSMYDVGQRTGAAMRRAAEYAGDTEGEAPTAAEAQPVAAQTEGEPPTTAAPVAAPPPDAERPGTIAQDMTRRLESIGMDRDQALAVAAVYEARYRTLAARMGGARGTAEDLYRAREANRKYVSQTHVARGPFEKGEAQTHAEHAAELILGGMSNRQIAKEVGNHLTEAQIEQIRQAVEPAPVPAKTEATPTVPTAPVATETRAEIIPARVAAPVAPVAEAAPPAWAVDRIALDAGVSREVVERAPQGAEPRHLMSEPEIAARYDLDGKRDVAKIKRIWEKNAEAYAERRAAARVAGQAAAPKPAETTAAAPPPMTEPPKAPGEIVSLDPTQIGVDAERFQFKSGTDEKGVTERLQDIGKWDARLAGTVLVWRDADGKLWIADGHQRLALAKRLIDAGQKDIRLNAFVLDEAHGITDADARQVAAAKNIAEGTGTAIDAAKVMRHAAESGTELPPLPPRSVLVRDGRALAKLAPEAFGMVVNDVVPIPQAAIVGRLITDPARQVEAMRVLAKLAPDNLRQAEMVVRDVLETAVDTTAQGGLFGAEQLATSATLERAKVADAAMRELSRDRSAFATLVREAERIEETGSNVLDIGANKERLTTDEQAKQLLTSLATTRGPVSDALTGIARRVRDGEISVAAGSREFLDAVRSNVARELAQRASPGGAEPGAAGGVEGGGQELFQRRSAPLLSDKAGLEREGQIPLFGRSATQAQAARDQAGNGRLAPSVPQLPPGGLFALPEAEQRSLFERIVYADVGQRPPEEIEREVQQANGAPAVGEGVGGGAESGAAAEHPGPVSASGEPVAGGAGAAGRGGEEQPAGDAAAGSGADTAADRGTRAEVAGLAKEAGEETEGRTLYQTFDAIAAKLGPERAGEEADANAEAASLVFEEAERAAKEWIAYHGTPHYYERVEPGHVGKGEGNQAFGWGVLYAAEDPRVADSYRVNLTKDPRDEINDLVRISGNPGGTHPWRDVASATDEQVRGWLRHALRHADSPALQAVATHEGTISDILEAIREKNADGTTTASGLRALRRLDSSLPKVRGHLLTVRIKVTPGEMLDWDRPLSEQTPKVRAALEKLGVPDKPHVMGEQAYAHLSGEALRERDVLHKMFRDRAANGDSREFKEDRARLDELQNPAEAASKALLREGIRGIRYLDAGSRGSFDSLTYKGKPFVSAEVKRALGNEAGDWGKILRAFDNLGSADSVDDALARMKARGADSERIAAIERHKADIDMKPPTRNVVVFHHDDVEITHRNGVAVEPKAMTTAEAREAQPEAEGGRTLFQREPPRVPLYSGVARAVERLPQTKGTGEQMAAMIARQPGVKPEEMKWLGLTDWLRGQKSVTREQIADYVRANALDVREVARGDRVGADWDRLYDVEQGARDALREALPERLPHPVATADTPDGVLHALAMGWAKAEDLPEEYQDAARAYVEAKADRERESETGAGRPKYAGYQLPGGANYRELLITLPEKTGAEPGDVALDHKANSLFGPTYNRAVKYDELSGGQKAQVRNALAHDERAMNFRSSHWDEPNVLAHVRFSERDTPDGKRTLLVEEVQSDWHQKGRREGYRLPASAWTPADAARIEELVANQHRLTPDQQNELQALRDKGTAIREERGIPDAPFKTTWPALAMKRIVKYAVDNGFDRVAWTPGDAQADRYDLSKQVKSVEYNEKTGRLFAPSARDDTAVKRDGVTVQHLPDLIGKEAAERMMAQAPDGTGQRVLSGVDLKVGGEGMRAFYDKMLPAEVNKIAGKFGAKVGTSQVATQGDYEINRVGPGDAHEVVQVRGDGAEDAPRRTFGTRAEAAAYVREHGLEAGSGTQQVHSLDISPTMRDAVASEGLPLFQRAQGKVHLEDGRAIITLMKDADASTFMHETAHVWLEDLLTDAAHEAAPPQLAADGQTVRRWLGAGENARITTRQHEKFARGFERYLMEGVAPSQGLARVFAQFKAWLTQIYQTVKRLRSPINDDIRQVFDRMLAEEPQRTVYADERAEPQGIAAAHEADAAETEPHEADAVADRVASEQDRYRADLRPEVASELPETAAAGPEAGAEPAGEVGDGGSEGAALGGGGGAAQPVAPGARGGGEPVAERARRGEATPEGAGVSGEPNGRRRAGAGTGPEQLAPRPAESLEGAEPRTVDLAGNIRVENLTDQEEIAQAIHDSADRNDEFRNVRGGMTKGQMMDLADAMGLDPSSIDEAMLARMFGGTQELGAKILAARKLVVQSADIVSGLMKTAAGSGNDRDIAALGVAIARHDLIQSTLAGVTAEWGRAGNAFHSLLAGWDKAQDLNQLLRDNLGRDLFQLQMLAKMGARLDTPGKISKYLRDAQKRSYGRMILEYWINGLISGVSTHVTYMVGNTILAAEKAGPETALAAAIGALRSRAGRAGERVLPGEAGAQLRAAVRELPLAIQSTIEAYRSGQTTLLPGETARPMAPFEGDTDLTMARNLTNAAVTWGEVKGDTYAMFQGLRDGIVANAELVRAGGVAGAPLIGTQYSPLGQIPDIAVRGVNVLPLGTLARLPSRNVAAIHSAFRAMNYSMEINRLAYRQAVTEGLEGEARAARVAQLRQDPPEAMMEQARGVATELTLMGQGGKFTNALSQFFNKSYDLPFLGETPVLKFVDPFVKIAGNIMNQALMQRTPVGLLSKEIRADLMGKNGNIAQDTAQAKMLMGSALAMTFGGLAAQGLMSGSGPSDPNKAAMWRLAGNQAHSVRIGDIWYDVHRLGPMGMLASVAADMYDVAHRISRDDADVVAKSLMHAFTQNILDESFMRGPSDLIRATTDPGRYGSSYVRTFLSSFLPYSVGMAQMARAVDPYSRQASTIMDRVKYGVPGLSDELLPRRDIWGEPMPVGGALVGRGITAIYERQMSADPVNMAMLNLGIAPAPVERQIRNVPLTDQQYDDFARIAGRTTKMRLDAIARSPDFQMWPNQTRYEVIEEVIRQSREAARGMMMMKYPQIPRDAAKAQIARKTGPGAPIE